MNQLFLNVIPYFLITLVTFFKIWILEKLFASPVIDSVSIDDSFKSNICSNLHYPINILYIGYIFMMFESVCRILSACVGIYGHIMIMYINFVLSLILIAIFYLMMFMMFKINEKFWKYLIFFMHVSVSIFGIWIVLYHLIKFIGYIYVVMKLLDIY